MKRLLLGAALAAAVSLAVPVVATAATTFHGTMSTAQHYCGAATYGPTYDVLGTWNISVGTQAADISFNYKNPGTGVHTTWSLLHDWQLLAADPYHLTNQSGIVAFDVLFAADSGAFQYTISLPSCAYTGWDTVVISGSGDRG